jgi:pyruvate dehydrogenase E1 component alpha subunit/2-oxoisovalerate dehydrogenase E1 component alpha subunit
VPATGDVMAYFRAEDDAKATGLFRILDENGVAHPRDITAAGIDVELARRIYRGMLVIRIMDERLLALQRQGRIGFYGEARGQEAGVVGSAAALERDDWLVPALREAGAGVFRGLPLDAYVAQIFGNANDVSRGRQLPCHPCHRDTNYVVMSSCVATQVPHAVGIAWAMKIRGDRGRVCLGYMGDGATSEADFHVALNFAGVLDVPVVLICQNNQWAISTPGALQTASETYAVKGLGYGIESLRVDGNDALATYTATRYAVDKARRGGGPTFLEFLTYRVGPHSSSDDPSRYRDESITEVWKERRDPIKRLKTFLVGRGWLSEADDETMAAAIDREVRDVIAAQESAGPPPLDSLIEDVYETPTRAARAGLDELTRHGTGKGG